MVRDESGKIELKTISIVIAFIVQVGVLVWGAAKLSSSVDQLVNQADHIQGRQDKLIEAVGVIQKFTAITEMRLDRIETVRAR